MRGSMAVGLVVLSVACGVPNKSVSTAAGAAASTSVPSSALAPRDREPGLKFVLRAGTYAEAAPSRVRQVAGAPVPDSEADAVLRTLPALPPEKRLHADFAKRSASLPPPTLVTQIEERLGEPPKARGTTRVEKIPVEVLRVIPEGAVDFAPELTVTFNQPMVALSSSQEAAAYHPIALTPSAPGRYRWLGTRTLAFTPATRLPMATRFRVEVPAGTRSASGSTLDKAVIHTFTTPGPKLVESTPTRDSPQLQTTRTPVVAVRFDQAIDRPGLVAQARFCHKRQCTQAREASPSELAAAEPARDLLARADREGLSKRVAILVPVAPLPADAPIAAHLGAVPSAEGPGRSSPVTVHFRTHGPLKIVGFRCEQTPCSPYAPLLVRLSNPVEATSLDLSQFKITDGGRLVGVAPSYGEHGMTDVAITAELRARARYTLTVPKGVRDVFGQVLEKPASFDFATGDVPASLDELPPLTVLDPRGPRALSVRSLGLSQLRVRVYQVSPELWTAFARVQELKREDQPTHLPGKKVLDSTVSVADPNAATSTRIDLSAAMPGGLGHAIVFVEPSRWKEPYVPRILTWVESTKIAVDGFFDRENAHAWVTRLDDGKPVRDATVTLLPEGVRATTDAHGLSNVALPDREGSVGRMLVATLGEDTVLLPERPYGGEGPSGWRKQPRAADLLRWFVIDDRGAYRPGERVHMKGWLRIAPEGGAGPLGLPEGLGYVAFEATTPSGHRVAQGKAKLGPMGGFDLTMSLPATVELGTLGIRLHVDGKREPRETWHSVLVEEFRRPEFEVSVHPRNDLHFAGDVITVDAKASSYTGNALQGAEALFSVSAEPAHFTPPMRGDYAFGEPVLWLARGPYGHLRMPRSQGPAETFAGTTDTAGAATVDIATQVPQPAYAHSLTVVATLQDVNRQALSDQTHLLVHPADVYVGLKSERWFVAAGEPLPVHVVAVDLEGKDVVGRPVEVRSVRIEATTSKGDTRELERDVQTCHFTSEGTSHLCTFKPREAGEYRILARVVDARGRANETRSAAWVTGPGTAPANYVQGSLVELLPNKSEYADKETAEVLIKAPFYPAEAIVRYARYGTRKIEHIHIAGPTHLLRVPIDGRDAPTLQVQVSLAGTHRVEGTKMGPRPAFAEGFVDLRIGLSRRRLLVEVRPQAESVAPGSQTRIDVLVRSPDGQPVVRGEVALAVVDEAVLALTGYTPGDPLRAFYPDAESEAWSAALRSHVLPDEPGAKTPPVMVAEGFGGAPAMELRSRDAAAAGSAFPKAARRPSMGRAPAPQLRTNFSPLALFNPSLQTDSNGVARVDFKLPDDLTRYRVIALAAADATLFGHGESTLTARKPLMVKPSAPRFLNFGDTFELPIVVENQGSKATTVVVAARASNLAFTQGRGRKVDVPAHDRVEIRLPMGTQNAGAGRIQVAVSSDQASDAAEVALPIWTPTTEEAFAVYGSLNGGAVSQPLLIPKDVYTQFGGLEISTSATQLAALTDSLQYIVDYPFDCSEQLASRILMLLALRDVLESFDVSNVPDRAAAQTLLGDAARLLLTRQNADGGFPTWSQGQESAPFHSVHALHALVRARKAGLGGLDQGIEQGRAFVARLGGLAPLAARPSLVAYGLYVESLLGSQIQQRAAKLWKDSQSSHLPVEAIGWLLSAVSSTDPRGDLAKAALTALKNRATETAGVARFTDHYTDTDRVLLHSDQRSTAVALEALMRNTPDSDLGPKVAKGLLAHRSRGRWNNTQDNVFAALALRAYFDHYEKDVPRFEARAFMGQSLLQSATFRGRTTEQHTTLIPMYWLAAQTPDALVLSQSGQGRMYYRLGLHYAPKQLDLAPEDQGFEIARSYEGVDDPRDAVQDRTGTWNIRAGARIRVNIELVSKASRYHVALVDPLPAGLEPVQTSLRVHAPPPFQKQRECRTCRHLESLTWYEHQNLRDDRAEAFASSLPAGVYSYSYLARATTPGHFVVPPTRAHEMYMPETAGRTATIRVIIH